MIKVIVEGLNFAKSKYVFTVWVKKFGGYERFKVIWLYADTFKFDFSFIRKTNFSYFRQAASKI